MWSLLSAVLFRLLDSHRANSFRRTHRHNRNCHRIAVFRLCIHHNRTESQMVGNTWTYKMSHSHRIDLDTRRDHRTQSPMECIGPYGIGTSLPSNCRAAYRQYSANIFRSTHLNYRRSPARKKGFVWDEKKVFVPRFHKPKLTFTLLHSAPISTQAP